MTRGAELRDLLASEEDVRPTARPERLGEVVQPLASSGGEGHDELGDVFVEALEDVAHDRLDYGLLVLITCEALCRFHCVPGRRHDYVDLVVQVAYEDLCAEEALERLEPRQHRRREMLAAVPVDSLSGPVAFPGRRGCPWCPW